MLVGLVESAALGEGEQQFAIILQIPIYEIACKELVFIYTPLCEKVWLVASFVSV